MSLEEAKHVFQCPLCGTALDERPDNCPRCNHTGVDFRDTTVEEMDVVSPEAIEHIHPIKDCLNYSVNRLTNRKTYHPLKLVTIIDKSRWIPRVKEAPNLPTNSFVVIKEQCEKCGKVYSEKRIPSTRKDLFEKYKVEI